jgi:peptidoglycan/LPS O-acetylase OafA/YrhL
MGLPGVPLALAATFATAEASWRLVERPALARKRRFSPAPELRHEVPAAAPLLPVAAEIPA